jgi:hypothetical protein
MKKFILFFAAAAFCMNSFIACAQFKSIEKATGVKLPSGTTTSGNKSSSSTSFTEGEAGDAIKEALMKGIANGVDIVSKPDGYFKNQFIKIPFPKEAEIVESTLRSVGAGAMADKVIESLNRAAEDAAQAAKPIFINSIKQLTVVDAMNIVTGSQQDAATQFLKRTTNTQLVSAFKPAIKKSLDKMYATKYWKEATTRYNKIPLVKKVNTDLPDYTTKKALDGLFYMVAQEEKKIRANPKAFGSSILDKVFGSVLKK